MSAEPREKTFDSFLRVYFSLILPFCFVWAVTAALEMGSMGARVIQLWQYPAVLLFGAGKMLVDRLFKLNKATMVTIFRELILAGAAALGLSLLLSWAPMLVTGIAPAPGHVGYLCGAFMVQWLITFRVDVLFLEHRRVRSFIRRDAAGGGHTEAVQRNPLIADLAGVLRRIRTHLLTLLMAYVGLLALLGWMTGSFDATGLAAGGVFLLVFFFGMFFLKILGDEQRRFCEGLFVPVDDRRRRLAAVVPILVFTAIIALMLASNRPLVDLSGLKFLLPSTTRMKPPDPGPTPEQSWLAWVEKLREIAPRAPGDWVRFVETGLYVLLGAAVIGFILLPLFSRAFRKALREKRLGRLLKQLWGRLGRWLVRLARALGRLFGRAVGEESGVPRGAPGSRKMAGSRRTAPVHREREAHRLVRQFRRLQRWSAARKMPYRRGQTAAEYINAIGGRYPGERERLGVILEVFERGLFSGRVLGRDDLHRYGESIHTVIRLR